ncbi:MAG: hypothetical protein ACHQF2_11275, partial [Flavobacteriales bacterium]
AIIALHACAPKVPFTMAVQEKYKLTDTDIKKIQFYTSEDIVLYKGESESKTETAGGEVVITSSKQEEKLIIKKGTPCVVVKIEGKDKLYLGFDAGDGKMLLFSGKSANDPFKLTAEEWVNNRGKLKYDGKTYYASSTSASTYLMFRLKKLEKSKRNQTVVKGRKVNE